MKVVVVFSGGMDSTALLWKLKSEGHTLKAISIDYGQRHRVELERARALASRANVPFEILDLSHIAPAIAGQSSQVNPNIEVPDGHYTEESMKATVVPNRNMIMLSVCAGHAIAIEFDAVAYGAHAGDHTIYPDCRPAFVEAMKGAFALCDWRQVQLLTPFLTLSKGQIAALGARLGVPFEDTWSCYKGGTLHCGTCGTCTERIEAFEHAGIEDPTAYE